MSGEEYFEQRQQQKQRIRHPPTPSPRQECAKHVCVTGERYDGSCLSKVGGQGGEIETEAELSRKKMVKLLKKLRLLKMCCSSEMRRHWRVSVEEPQDSRADLRRGWWWRWYGCLGPAL